MASRSVVVDPANAAQLEAWDGDEGAYWAANADRFDRSIAEHHRPFMIAAAIAPGDVVLDVGCGTGQTTIEAAMSSAGGPALGVDLSEAMLDVARRRAADADVTTASFTRADAQIHGFENSATDVVLGRTSAMFFGDHAAAFTNLRTALRPDGRIVLLTWQPLDGNEWLQVIATSLSPDGPPRLPPSGAGPFSLSEPARITTLLTDAGFRDVELAPSVAPMHFGADAADAVQFILGLQGWMLHGCDDDARRRAVEALHDACEAHERVSGVEFASAAWITTAHV
jgi:SAM-dependent methyltransferase